jgi:hypothetical protein
VGYEFQVPGPTQDPSLVENTTISYRTIDTTARFLNYEGCVGAVPGTHIYFDGSIEVGSEVGGEFLNRQITELSVITPTGSWLRNRNKPT